MTWFLMNVPLAAACFAAWAGIPLYLVLKHPHWGPAHSDPHRHVAAEPPAWLAEERQEQLVGVAASPDGSRYHR